VLVVDLSARARSARKNGAKGEGQGNHYYFLEQGRAVRLARPIFSRRMGRKPPPQFFLWGGGGGGGEKKRNRSLLS
jgi:hypothetical protein